ncbi:hypothetical protein BJ165DRAFT_861432 [Panaeolus papilionaceus]|nr:hypothetical protein BJ165DRAFT_861432 [Panaeolus papilionaceus]
MRSTTILQLALLATTVQALPIVQLFKPPSSAGISSRQFPNPTCADSGLDPSLCVDDRKVVERQFPNPTCADSGLDPSLCIDDRQVKVEERQFPNPICSDSGLDPSLC